MKRNDPSKLWIAYLRVSTQEQADKELSIPNQRREVEGYAARHGRAIEREYVDPGRSGTNEKRPGFQQMLSDIFSRKIVVECIVVYHTSRFGRNSTQVRLTKQKLRRFGVRVIAVCQETSDDVCGRFSEHIHEDVDEYESEVNGMRTSEAMAEVARQGFFPGSKAPYGFEKKKIEIRPDVFRSVLVVNECEASAVSDIFQLYLADNGAKAVARTLNQRGVLYREGLLWSKTRVLAVLDNHVAVGRYYWRKFNLKEGVRRDESEWIAIQVESLVDSAIFDVAAQLRRERDPQERPGSPSSGGCLLYRLIRCAKCGASYQLETSTKQRSTGTYTYRYYNCRQACRIGKEACVGARVTASRLDALVLRYLTDVVCSPARCRALVEELERGVMEQRRQRRILELREALASIQERIRSWEDMLRIDEGKRSLGEPLVRELKQHEADVLTILSTTETQAAQPIVTPADKEGDAVPTFEPVWRSLVATDGHVARNYLRHIVDRVEVNGPGSIRIVPRAEFTGSKEVTYFDPIESPGGTAEPAFRSETMATIRERKERQRREFEERLEQGRTRTEIAREFGISRARVTQVLRRPRESTSAPRDPVVNTFDPLVKTRSASSQSL